MAVAGELTQAQPMISRRNKILLAIAGAFLVVYWLFGTIASLLRG